MCNTMKLPPKNELKEEREKSLTLLEGYKISLQILEQSDKVVAESFTLTLIHIELTTVNDHIIYLREQLGENFEENKKYEQN